MSRPAVRGDLSRLTGYHSPQVDVDVRLNTNESPWPPPDAWFTALSASVSAMKVNRYPDRRAADLRAAVARLHGVEVENVYCANGSNEVLQTLLLAYGGAGRRAGVFEPTYAMHSQIARSTGTDVLVGGRDGDDFAIPAGVLTGMAAGVDVLFLCSPNNPTGTLVDEQSVRRALSATKGLVVVDEAYGQFASWSATALLGEDVPLVVTRTFSKTWAMAGVRLGYLLGPTWLVADLEKVGLPYHLSSITQEAGLLALRFEPEMRERVAVLVSERERIQSVMARLPVRSWPSDANFILFRPTAIDGTAVWQSLIERSVLVRDCDNWPGVSNCLRVTVGTPAENDRFLSALEETLT